MERILPSWCSRFAFLSLFVGLRQSVRSFVQRTAAWQPSDDENSKIKNETAVAGSQSGSLITHAGHLRDLQYRYPVQ